jgi:hypothetical protein
MPEQPIKKRRLDLYFEPVYPMETSDTVKGSIILKEQTDSWKTPLDIKTCTSSLKEKTNVELSNNCFVPEARKKVAFFSKECKLRGTCAEKLFLDLVILKNKWIPKIIEDASTYDYLYHVDFMFKNPLNHQEEIWVDVKSLRATRRNWPLQSEYMWVELNSGGWLFGGKSTIIAQQISEDSFVLLDREKMCEFVKQTVRVDLPIVAYAEQSYNRVYLRETKNQNGTFCFTCALSLMNLKELYEKVGCGILNN